MSDIAAMTFANAKQRFSNRVADYARYRPGYPSGVLQLLRERCGLRPEHIIADLGSGTGLLSRPFLDNGNRVFGVEPNSEMRRAGEEFLRGYGDFTSMDGSAEATGLADGSVDFVTAGQAFHWFEPVAARAEFLRILRPSGWAVILWQDRRMEEAPFTREYEELLERYGTDYRRVKEAYPEGEKIREFFDAGSFGSCDLPNYQELDWEGVSGRLRSSSFVPTEGHADFPHMMNDLRKIFAAHEQDGRVRMDYYARVYFGQIDLDRNAG